MASFFRDNANYYDSYVPNKATDDDEESCYNRIVPLIFAVNAISTECDISLFDTFVNALEVSSLVGADTSNNVGSRNSMGLAASLVSSTATNMAAARRTISLFRSEDDEDDDSDIDEYCADGMVVGINPNANTGRNFLVNGLRRQGVNNSLNSSNHGAITITSSSRQGGATDLTISTSSTLYDNNVVSYSRVLNSEQSQSGFFPSARIVSVSSRYGFPPSKNPSGENNLATSLASAVQSLQGSQQQYYQNARKRPQQNHQNQQQISYNNVVDEKRAVIQSVFSQYKKTMAGILPSGWIEKHVHALPSVIIVVCTVSSTNRMTDQKKQDSFLYETIEHLQYSLVPKRRCRIQIVALLHPDVTAAQADTWTNTVMNEVLANSPNVDDLGTSQGASASASTGTNNNIETSNGQVSIISLRVGDDIEQTTTTTPSMRVLHKAVRDASLLYYLRQARRCRSKLSKLLMLSLSDDSASQARRRGIRNPSAVTSGSIKPPPLVLSPIIIRTCIKAAIFYEFQLSKYEKVSLFYNEAYRYAMRYYEWLIRTENGTYLANGIDNRGIGDDDNASTGSSDFNYSVHGASSSDNGDMSEGIEIEIGKIELSSSTAKSFSTGVTQTTRIPSKLPSWSRYIPFPSDETMSFQTRIIAERLFAKLSSLALSSRTEHGYNAVANLWRQHTRTFGVGSEKFDYQKASFPKAFSSDGNHIHQPDPNSHVDDDIDDTILTSDYDVLLQHTGWYDWLCISRERLLICLMLQHYPIDDVNTVVGARVAMDCSIWRAYVSTAEAMLKLEREMELMKLKLGPLDDEAETTTQSTINSNAADSMRHRYVGSITSDTLESHYQKELNSQHREKALEYVLTAISYFENEMISQKKGFYAEDEFDEKSSSRTGARVYYLAGGILLGLGRCEEAASHLIKAAKHVTGWRELEMGIRRMLIECYERHLPSNTTTLGSNENSETLISMILDSYFNAKMSSTDLHRALNHFASISGGESLKWYHSTASEDESTEIPFSFAVSFPGKTHATAGDNVQASVMIKSNLDYAVHINSVELKSLAGCIPIESNDLMCATNASEGNERGIIIQAQTSIVVTTNIRLPRDLSMIASDDTGNGGEQLGVAGKGSFAKSARPRSAGISAAGGARLVSEDCLPPGNRNTQGWSMRYLGGKPLLCDGIHIVFYPVQAEVTSGSAEKVTLIELVIEKKSSRTAANIKRTPFEEENYIASAWSRPSKLPLASGPRSIRVLSAQPQLIITAITEDITKGKALEGTVNRILLRLQAGSLEVCSNIQILVTCFNVLLTPNGTTKRLIPDSAAQTEKENSIDMFKSCFRTPSLVTKLQQDTPTSSCFGYDLPVGWNSAGTGDSYSYVCPVSLKAGEASFVPIDFYRPATVNTSQGELLSYMECPEEDLADISLCKTDYYVTVRYQQERPSAVKPKVAKRAIRRRPQMGQTKANVEDAIDGKDSSETVVSECDGTDNYDEVSLERTGTLVWASPLSATFHSGPSLEYSAGSRHEVNAVGFEQRKKQVEHSLKDGECAIAHCSIQLDGAMEGMDTKIVSVRFEDTDDTKSLVAFSLVSNDSASGANNTIYKASNDDPCHVLSAGASFGISYGIRGILRDVTTTGVSTHLGGILVDWLPSGLSLPTDVSKFDIQLLSGVLAHGPLALDFPATVSFRGPPCYIEASPFEAELVFLHTEVRLNTPFEVQYRIKNKTSVHQRLYYHLDEETSAPISESGLIISGLTDGDVWLGPSEQQFLSFLIVPVRPGELTYPILQISAERYRTWVINSGTVHSRLFVLP